MALLVPFSYTLTQRWGPTANTAEPHMYAYLGRAWWSYPGYPFQYYYHFHPGIDMAAPEGTPILAGEAGIVTRASYDSINGNSINVDIRPFPGGTRYVHGHMRDFAVGFGQHVARGQLLGHVGHTGAATGPHSHHGIQIGSMLYDPTLFYPGGANANDPRILPPSTADVFIGHIVQIEGPCTLNMYVVGSDCSLSKHTQVFSGASTAPVVRGACGTRTYWKTTLGPLTGISYVCGLTTDGWHISRQYRRSNGSTYDVRIACTSS